MIPIQSTEDQIRRKRYDEARDAGLSPLDAALFADSGIDVGDLRKLVDGGCSPELIARILF